MLWTVYVPYDPAVWHQFWNSTMTTIASSVNIGFVVFIVPFGIILFRTVLGFFD